MLTPKEIVFESIQIGIGKVNRKNIIVFISAILGGFYIGLGFYGYIVASSGFMNTNYSILGNILGAIVFPVGLVLIIITGADLFTGNCLIFFGWLDKRFRLWYVFKNLLIVYMGNLVGSLFLVGLIYYSNLSSSEVIKDFIVTVSERKVNINFLEGLTRGILCNILVSMAVYMSYASKTIPGKILAAILPVSLFVICGFEPSVANMFIIPLGYFSGADITLKGLFINNLLPVTLGNFIGGGIIISGAYYLIYRKK